MRKLLELLCRVTLIATALIAVATAAVIAIRYTIIAVITATALWFRTRRNWKGSSTHGTAHFASMAQLERGGHLDRGDGRSLILGRVGDFAGRVTKAQAVRALLSPATPSELAVLLFFAAFFKSRRLSRRFVRVHDYCHLAGVSRSGGGKGIGLVLPVLLSYTASMFILDPKCELFKISACVRNKRMGHTIIRLDPMGLGGPGAASFNPLDFIDPTALDFLDMCRDLANMLVVRTGQEHEPFWNDAAELILTATIAFVLCCSAKPEHKHLGTISMILASPESFEEAVEAMRKSSNPLIAELGGQCSWFEEKVRSSVLTNVNRHISWMNSPALTACLKSSDFDPKILKREKVSVFCVIPPSRMTTWAPWVRMVVGSTLRIISREGASEHDQVLFMLDEVAQLGRFQALEDAICIMRGYGVRLFFILQSFEQLKTCYGDKAGVVLDNIGTLIAFNVNSLETAEMLSRRMGDETIRYSTPNRNYGSGSSTTTSGTPSQSVNRSDSYGSNTAQQGRRLATADEILRSRDIAYIFHNQMPPIAAERLAYFRDPEFKGGRTGRQPGVGLAVGLAAMIVLAASVAFAGLVSRLPVAEFRLPGQLRYGAWHSGFSSPRRKQIDDGSAFDIYTMSPDFESVGYGEADSTTIPESESAPSPRTLPSRRRWQKYLNDLRRTSKPGASGRSPDPSSRKGSFDGR